MFPGPCCVDSVARCLVMNMTQFSGKHGCGWCEAKGEQVVGRGTARVYPLDRPLPKMRTEKSMKRKAVGAEQEGSPISGIKRKKHLVPTYRLRLPLRVRSGLRARRPFWVCQVDSVHVVHARGF